MVVPEIAIKLKLPLLGTAINGFLSKGYSFADAGLHSSISEIKDIDILLGSDAAHCILGRDVKFGKGQPSVYVDSPKGIMLVGNIHNLLDNLPFLPQASPLPVSASHSCSVSMDSFVQVNTHSFLTADFITPTIDDEIHELH